MTLLLHNHPQDVTQEEFEKDFLLLPEWRRKKVLIFRFLIDRVLCTKAYLLLKQGLSSEFGIHGNVDDLPALFTTEVLRKIKFETVVGEEHGYVYTTCTYL